MEQKNESLERLFMQCSYSKKPTLPKAKESQIETTRRTSDQSAGNTQAKISSCELPCSHVSYKALNILHGRTENL